MNSRFRPSWLVLAFLTSFACTTADPAIVRCEEDADCEPFGSGAICEANDFCSLEDDECNTGRRWHEGAGDGLSSTCWNPEDLAESDETGDEGDGTTTSEPGSTGSPEVPPPDSSTGSEDDTLGMTTTFTTAGETEAPATTGEEEDTGNGDDDTGGGATTGDDDPCAERFGGSEGFEVCEETAEQCTVAVTLGGESCASFCESRERTCLSAIRNGESGCEMSEEGGTCDEMVESQICVCSR